MIIHNNELLSTYEVFWHLYLATIESPADILPLLSEAQVNAQSLATKVFRSLEKKGVYPLHPYGDDYCLSMPEDRDEFELKKQDLINQMTFKLWRSHPDGSCEQLLETLLNVAEALASTEVEYKPLIKAFIIWGSQTMALVHQGYVAENCLGIQDDLVEASYLRPDWQDFTEWDAMRVDAIKKALVRAIANGYFGGDTSIQVY